MIVLKVQAIGFREASGRFAAMTPRLRRAKREVIREGGAGFVGELSMAAPVRETGELSRGFRYRTDERGAVTTTTVYAQGPHAWVIPLIVRGTAAHPISATRGRALRFYWPKGFRGPGVYFFARVMHPGTRPNPFVERAFGAWWPRWRSIVNPRIERAVRV